MILSRYFAVSVLFLALGAAKKKDGGGDDEWVHLPNKCEVCKFVSIEMKSAFEETGKTKEVIDRNYRFIDGKGAAPIKYVKSDLRFIEVVENVCQRLLEYNLHKERSGSNRFAKGMSETFSTLHGLVNKGVNVVMDIPFELWNETSAEVADLKKQCDVLVEQYEEVIEDWYKGDQSEDLTTFLCEKHVLKGQDTECLSEQWSKKKGERAAIAEDKNNSATNNKKKKKKKKSSKTSDSEKNQDQTLKKKKKKKSKGLVQDQDQEQEQEQVQPQRPLSDRTEL